MFSYLQSCSSLLPRLAYFFVRLLLDDEKEAAWLSVTHIHKCPKTKTRNYNTQEQAHRKRWPTWVAWRSSVLPLSAPSQTLCNAPAGRGPTVCACRCDHTGPKRGTTHRNACFYTCICTQTVEDSVEKQQNSADTAQSQGLWLRFCSVIQFKLKLRMVTSVQDPNPFLCTV